MLKFTHSRKKNLLFFTILLTAMSMELRHWQFKAIWKSIVLAEKKFLAEILEQIHNFDCGLNKIPPPDKERVAVDCCIQNANKKCCRRLNNDIMKTNYFCFFFCFFRFFCVGRQAIIWNKPRKKMEKWIENI